jgi:hypothetical protein
MRRSHCPRYTNGWGVSASGHVIRASWQSMWYQVLLSSPDRKREAGPTTTYQVILFQDADEFQARDVVKHGTDSRPVMSGTH